MDELKVEHLKGLCVINATKHLMKKENITHEDAYKKFLSSETYKLLMNTDSGMYLESDKYIIEALNIEFGKGKDSLIEFVNEN